MRLPYFNALDYFLQVELIRRSRQEALSPLASKILHITINGLRQACVILVDSSSKSTV